MERRAPRQIKQRRRENQDPKAEPISAVQDVEGPKPEVKPTSQGSANKSSGQQGTRGRNNGYRNGWRGGRNWRGNNNTRRLANTVKSEIKTLTYGPPSTELLSKENNDASVSAEYYVKGERVCLIVQAVLSQASTHRAGASSDVNLYHVHKFLYDYLTSWWLGRRNDFVFLKFPAVLLDLMHAGEEKTAGGKTASVIGVEGNYVPPDKGFSSQFGPRKDSGQGYAALDTSGTYTADAAFIMTKKFLSDASEALHCVDVKTYRKISSDDFSFYSSLKVDVDSVLGKHFTESVDGTLMLPYVGDIHCFGKCRARWIAIATPVRDAKASDPAFVNNPVFKNKTSVSAILVHRIRNGLEGYSKSELQVLVKPVDTFLLMKIFSEIVYAAIKSNMTDNFVYPYNNVDVELNQAGWTMAVFWLIVRRFRPWMAVANTMMVTNVGNSHNVGRFLPCGNLDIPDPLVDSMMSIKAFEFSLSCLSPYQRSNTFVYPVPLITSDYQTGLFPSLGWAPTVAPISAAFDFIASTIKPASTIITVTTYQMTGVNQIIFNWNKSCSFLQGWMEICTAPPSSPFNFASLSAYLQPPATDKLDPGNVVRLAGYIYAQDFDESFKGLLSRMVIPHCYIDSGGDTNYDNQRGQWQFIFQEPKHQAVMIVGDVGRWSDYLAGNFWGYAHKPDQNGFVPSGPEQESSSYFPSGVGDFMKIIKAAPTVIGAATGALAMVQQRRARQVFAEL